MKDFEVLYTEFDYRTNDTDEVRRLSVSGSGELVCEGCHDAGTLSCSVTTDPDGHVVQSFTDGQGRTLLNRTFDGDEPIDTYSVYDDAGRLRWVVTPEGSYLLGDSQTFAANDDFAEKYCYIYTYDERGRTVEKQLPGREAEYMVYDPGDRLIMSQDGNLRSQDQWIVYCYDDFGRLTEQRLGTVPDSAGGLTGAFENNPLFLYMTFMNDPTVPPLRSCTYDSYPSVVQAAGLGFQPIEGLTSEDGVSLRYENAQGSMTYEKLAVLADGAISGYHERAYYYDYRGRVIQTVERDAEEGILCTSQRYDFIGNLLARQERYTNVNSAIDDCIDRTFEYDSRNRLLKETAQFNGGEQAVVAYTYDDLGQLTGKTYGTGTYAIHETMDYNLQGWLTEKSSELFDMRLDYFESYRDWLTPSYRGNIATWWWQHKNIDGTANGDEYAYGYCYDDLSRLTAAQQFWSDSEGPEDSFTEKGISYDKNSNILTLNRTSLSAGDVKSYQFSYSGNQRIKETTTDSEYAYDANGNITHDAANGLEISYNLLNLPTKLFCWGDYAEYYDYLADGTKVRHAYQDGQERIYAGSLVYDQGVFESAPFGGGRIVGTYDDSEAHYFLTDHIGSTRVVAKVTAAGRDDLDRKDYYPFGKAWTQADMPTSGNRYTFSGKEQVDVAIEDGITTPIHDFGARYYDPDGVLFFQQDRFTEKYYNISSYQYAANSPSNYIDINGDSLWIEHRKTRLLYQDGMLYNSDGSKYTGKTKGYIKKTIKDLNKIGEGKKGAILLKSISNSKLNIIIKYGKNSFNPDNLNKASLAAVNPKFAHIAGSGGIVYYNPSSKYSGPDVNGSTSRPSFIGLAHELGHGIKAINGTANYSLYDPNHPDIELRTVTNDEYNAIEIENQVRQEHNIPLRQYYTVDSQGNGFIRAILPATIN